MTWQRIVAQSAHDAGGAPDLVQSLRHAARLLQARARAGDERTLERIAAGAGPLEADPCGRRIVQRRHCLQVVARHLGFAGWPHAKQVLSGERCEDAGTLMYRDTGGAITNIWSASYEEAAGIRREHGGFLLPYRRHFQIVEAPYIEWLGPDPADADWDRIGRDWVCPTDRAGWCRLTARVVARRLRDLGLDSSSSQPPGGSAEPAREGR